MPKIAVLISGEYRKFDITRKTMTFLDDPAVDVYVSTWDKTIYSSPKINLYKEYSVNEEIIRRDLNRSAVIRIDSHRLFIEKKYNCKMINRWLAGFELIKNSGIKYDNVIIIRPDLFFVKSAAPSDLRFLEKYNTGIAFVWATSLERSKLGDILYTSSYQNISTLISQLTVDKWLNDPENDWHIWWYNFVRRIFPEIFNCIEFDYVTFCRYWTTNEHNFQDVVETQHDWRDLRLLHEIDLMGKQWMNDSQIWPVEVVNNALDRWNSGYFDKYK